MQKNPGQQGPLGEDNPHSPQNIPGRPQREKRISKQRGEKIKNPKAQESCCAACTVWKAKGRLWEIKSLRISTTGTEPHPNSAHAPLGTPECEPSLQKPVGTPPVGAGSSFDSGFFCLHFLKAKTHQRLGKRELQRDHPPLDRCQESIPSPAGHCWHLSAWLRP